VVNAFDFPSEHLCELTAPRVIIPRNNPVHRCVIS
jgi:hypothetical protein